jgi:FHS family L-fucose permease-like MFS transporter
MAIITVIAVTAIYMITGSTTIALTVLGLVVGNAAAFILGRSKPAQTLALFSVIVVGLLFVTGFSEGNVALWSVIAIGLFNSIMFPTIFTLAIRDLGKYTGQGSSLLVMAIVGGAILTPLMGWIVGQIGYQKAMVFVTIPYLYIFYYGWKGYKIKSAS